MFTNREANMKRADTIDCPHKDCKAKIGQPCGYDSTDLDDTRKLMPGQLGYTMRPGATYNRAPWWHAVRSDAANGWPHRSEEYKEDVPAHWERTGVNC